MKSHSFLIVIVLFVVVKECYSIEKSCSGLFVILYFICAQRLALPALGRTAERRPMRKRLRRGKCLKNAQTPQRQVHALLGAE